MSEEKKTEGPVTQDPAVVGVLRGLAALCSGPVRRASIVANNEDLDGFWEGLHHDPPSASLKRALL